MRRCGPAGLRGARQGLAALVALGVLPGVTLADAEQVPPVSAPAGSTQRAVEPAANPSDPERAAEIERRIEAALVYQPPARGRPRSRVGGGVRGVPTASLPRVVALAPDHTGATLAPRPSLFWYVSGPIPAEAGWVFALVDPTRIEPALEVPLTSPAGAGIQRIDLEQLGGPSFGLEPGVEYEWSVALVLDENERARDVVSLGWIDRIARPSGLAERAGAVELARHGLWYDALAALEDALAASPGDPQLRAERAALLDQGGLGLDPPGARK